jgi:hypothetical protein
MFSAYHNHWPEKPKHDDCDADQVCVSTDGTKQQSSHQGKNDLRKVNSETYNPPPPSLSSSAFFARSVTTGVFFDAGAASAIFGFLGVH